MIRSASLLALLALGLPAEAQLEKAASPEGVWTFVSSLMPDQCVLSGDMSVRKTASGFTCSFTGSWACKSGPEPMVANTMQTCTATQKGSDIAIISKVEKIVSTQPPGMVKQMEGNYLADNFNVTINAAGDEMEGRSFDPANEARIKFRRKGQLIS